MCFVDFVLCLIHFNLVPFTLVVTVNNIFKPKVETISIFLVMNIVVRVLYEQRLRTSLPLALNIPVRHI